MSEFYNIFFIIFFIYLILFLISIKIKDNSIVDIFWWIWFILIACYSYTINNNITLINTLSLLIILLWWFRLSFYVWKRNLKSKKEDYRYLEWRQTWKYFYLRSFFQIYILQMTIMFIVSFPIYYIFSWKDINIIYFFLWFTISIIWLIIEIISDKQIKDYLKQNWKTNLVFTWWLYKYSRNPNYFWESTFWLWLSIIWASINILSFIWFITITFLLLFVSWVPLKEKRQSKKLNWDSYKEKTSIFIPWFPKK